MKGCISTININTRHGFGLIIRAKVSKQYSNLTNNIKKNENTTRKTHFLKINANSTNSVNFWNVADLQIKTYFIPGVDCLPNFPFIFSS